MSYGESGYSPYEQAYKYNASEIETVQKATIGSGAVRYNTAPAAEVDSSVETPEEKREENPEENPEEKLEEKLEEKPEDKDVQPDTTELLQDTSQQLCRDFLNGTCGRIGCKFKHDTPGRDTPARDNERTKLPICKDYQNMKCHRASCKYLHMTQAEEEEYQKTGVMPQNKSVEQKDVGTVNICRDFKNGYCRRGQGCKFSHKTEQLGESFYGKRPYSAVSDLSMGTGGDPQQENDSLKQKVLELRKQVLELQQLNEVLYKENLRFRDQLPADTLGSEKMSLLPNSYAVNGGRY